MTPGKKGGLASVTKQASNETITVGLRNVQMELRSANTGNLYIQPAQQQKAYFDQMFTMADKGKKGSST